MQFDSMLSLEMYLESESHKGQPFMIKRRNDWKARVRIIGNFSVCTKFTESVFKFNSSRPFFCVFREPHYILLNLIFSDNKIRQSLDMTKWFVFIQDMDAKSGFL